MAEENTTSNKISFTEGETALFTAIMEDLTNEIQFDADAVATKLGYKSGKTVKDRWSQIKKKKLISGSTASPGGIKKSPAPKKTPKKASKEDEAAAGGEGTGETSGSPKKREAKKGTKGAAKSAAKVKQEEMEDAGESAE